MVVLCRLEVFLGWECGVLVGVEVRCCGLCRGVGGYSSNQAHRGEVLKSLGCVVLLLVVCLSITKSIYLTYTGYNNDL